jgi:hypothetical protein|nr:MAG TPA: tail-collar fiber protein [Caudoviricetes sp.]
MSNYGAITTTQLGKNMIAESFKTKKGIIFTKVALGEGLLNSGNINDLTNLVSKVVDGEVSTINTISTNEIEVVSTINNRALTRGYYARELGLFAKLGEGGQEKLFAYTNAGADASYVPSNASIDEKIITITIGIGNASITINPKSHIYLTEARLNQHENDINAHGGIMKKFLPLTGGTVTGSVTLENGSWLKLNHNNFSGAVRITERGTLDVGISDNANGSVENMNICSMNRPGWYNKNLGSARQLALVEEINQAEARFNASLNGYLPLAGGTLTGDLTFNSGNGIKIKGEGGNHTISRGGKNLNLGNESFTEASNLCCKKRPSWYAGPDNVNNGFLMKLSDISVTSGTISDGQTLPIPSGYSKEECTVLLSLSKSNAENIYVDIRESGIANSVQVECWADNNLTAHVGMWWRNNEGYSHSAYGNGEGKGDTWLPGEATYICIALKRA